MTAGVILAKKTSKPTKLGTPTPSDPAPPKSPVRAKGERSDFVRFRVTASYKEWIGRFAESERSDMSDLFDDAMTAYAKEQGFEAPPKR